MVSLPRLPSKVRGLLRRQTAVHLATLRNRSVCSIREEYRNFKLSEETIRPKERVDF